IWARQFANEANAEIHYRTTGEEIWRDTEGQVDALVSGIGAGGAITGAGRKLREHKADVHIVAVEPEDSPLLSGRQPGPHKLQGIGPNFVPEVLDTEIYNEVLTSKLETAIATSRELGVKEGILGGISTGSMV